MTQNNIQEEELLKNSIYQFDKDLRLGLAVNRYKNGIIYFLGLTLYKGADYSGINLIYHDFEKYDVDMDEFILDKTTDPNSKCIGLVPLTKSAYETIILYDLKPKLNNLNIKAQELEFQLNLFWI